MFFVKLLNCHLHNDAKHDFHCIAPREPSPFPDENDCNLFIPSKSYIVDMPPEPKKGDNMTYIKVGVDVLSILDISEVGSYIALQLTLRYTYSNH